MEEKLRALETRYESLEYSLSDPGIYNAPERYREINRELKELAPLIEAYQAWKAAEKTRRETEELLSDPDLKELARDDSCQKALLSDFY